MSILNKIKQGVAQSGSNKGKMLFLKADSKTRVRFLEEIEDGIEVLEHDDFDTGINAICQKHLGKKCPYCNDESLRHRNAYVFSVWDYDAKEVKLFQGFPNNFNPLPALIAMYESYETIMDRDYVIQRTGGGMQTSYSVVPMDKVKFRDKKAKPYSEKKKLEIMDKAFPVDPGDEIDPDSGIDNEDEQEFDDSDENENEYEDKSPKELYMLCIERDIKAEKKKKRQYYVDLLVEDDNAPDEDDDWEDNEDDEDEW